MHINNIITCTTTTTTSSLHTQQQHHHMHINTSSQTHQQHHHSYSNIITYTTTSSHTQQHHHIHNNTITYITTTTTSPTHDNNSERPDRQLFYASLAGPIIKQHVITDGRSRDLITMHPHDVTGVNIRRSRPSAAEAVHLNANCCPCKQSSIY